MNNMIYILTGVSKGLGKALTENLLAQNSSVIGVGRSHDFDHPKFSFIQCDLSDKSAVENIKISIPPAPVTLINNAGIIGEIKRLADQSKPDVLDVLMLNTVAPVVLWHKIYNLVSNKDDFTLVNITSGAANRAIPSWAAYCASKAALNMLSETFMLEEKEKGNNPRVYAVAPGVMDTSMQKQIRNSSEDDFSSVKNFIALKENDALFSPEEAANRLLQLLNKPYSGEVFYDLRSIEPQKAPA